jgi:hypothetical protein
VHACGQGIVDPRPSHPLEAHTLCFGAQPFTFQPRVSISPLVLFHLSQSGNFYGDFSTFIFQLSPAMRVYKATGINENFMWCGVGFKELPCGIG